MTVVFGDGMMVKKPKGSDENAAPKAVETEKPVTTAKKRGAKKEK